MKKVASERIDPSDYMLLNEWSTAGNPETFVLRNRALVSLKFLIAFIAAMDFEIFLKKMKPQRFNEKVRKRKSRIIV